MRPTPLLLVLLLGAVGCGNRGVEEVPQVTSGTPPFAAAVPAPTEDLVALGTVIDAGEGPRLCLGPVAESFPPQCDGPRLSGWEWPQGTSQRAEGVRWGEYAVTGTFDGATFTVTADPVPSGLFDGAPLEQAGGRDFATPCPEPEGGWEPPEPERATEATLAEVTALAEGLPEVSELWIDQSPNPYDGSEDPVEIERLDDPLLMVLNVRVAADAEGRRAVEDRLREVWGGALCVSADEVTADDLAAVRSEVTAVGEEIGLLDVFPARDRLDVEVLYDDGSLQADLDEAYGAGVVRVLSAMRPFGEVYPDEP